MTELAPAPTGGGSYVFVITAESSAAATLPIGGTLTIGWYLASGTNAATMLQIWAVEVQAVASGLLLPVRLVDALGEYSMGYQRRAVGPHTLI